MTEVLKCFPLNNLERTDGNNKYESIQDMHSIFESWLDSVWFGGIWLGLVCFGLDFHKRKNKWNEILSCCAAKNVLIPHSANGST